MNLIQATFKRTYEIMAEKGITVADLNGHGISQKTLNALSNGTPADMVIEDFECLCRALGMEIPDFVDSELFL